MASLEKFASVKCLSPHETNKEWPSLKDEKNKRKEEISFKSVKKNIQSAKLASKDLKYKIFFNFISFKVFLLFLI